MADRLVAKLMGQRSPAPKAEQVKPKPPLSVKARIEDARAARANTSRKVRGLRLF